MKIPTLFGLSIIIVAIALGLMFHFYNQTKTQTTQKDLTPQNIRITNQTPTSFTVTWFTNTPAVGTLVFGPDTNLGTSQNDDRDQEPIARKSHTITVTNRSPQTTYFFKIRNDTFFFPQTPLSVTTPSNASPNLSATNRPLTGTLTTTTSQNPIDILIFLQTEVGADLSGYVDNNLNYLVPLNNLRTKNLEAPINLDPNSPINANLLITNFEKNSYILLQLPQSQPIPTLTLGQNIELDRPTTATNSPSLLPLN